MIVEIGKGAGFKGAAAYILHDKTKEGQEHAQTAERVGFAYAINCGDSKNLPRALTRMIDTSDRAKEIKVAAGGSAAGHKLEKPLKTVVLSWNEGEQPTEKEQKSAVSLFLKSMGWQDHQAIIASHTDTDKPHVHILINAVNPTTGKKLNDSLERRRADKWAIKYMHDRGQVRIDEVKRAEKSKDPAKMQELEKINPEQVADFTNQPEKKQTPEQQAKAALAKSQKADWSKHRKQQNKEKTALRAVQGKAYKEQAKTATAERRAIPKEVAADVYAQFAGRFDAVKELPFDQRHGARENLKAEMAGIRAIEKQARLERLQAQRVELMKEQKRERDSLSKEHKQGSQHLSKSHSAAYQSLDIHHQQTALQKSQLTMTRARNKALLQATKSGTGIDPNSYYNRLVRRQELENRGAGADRAQDFRTAYNQLTQDSQQQRSEQERQQEGLQESRARSAEFVKDAQEAGGEVTDRKQETKDHQIDRQPPEHAPDRPEVQQQTKKRGLKR